SPIIGWVSFDNSISAWNTIRRDIPGVWSDWQDTAAPLPTDFEIYFPLSDQRFTADAAGTRPLRSEFQAVDNTNSTLVVRTRDNNSPAGLFDARLELRSGNSNALDSYRPSVVSVNDFASRSLILSDQRVSGFAIVASFGLSAPVSAPAPTVSATASLFAAYGTFEAQLADGSIAGWNVSGPGSADVIQLAGDNNVVRLTTGSPVELSQLIDTPSEAFTLSFDYEFLTDTGTLEVYLADTLLGTLDAPATPPGSFDNASFTLSDAALFNLAGAELAFVFDGFTGSQIDIDNVMAVSTPVPLPSALVLLAAGLGGLLARSRRF
ncbi:MAG: hypothetical protein ACU84Q_14425, partial [Gammaproteobacteria bacterium]